jgi:hypothetical protein
MFKTINAHEHRFYKSLIEPFLKKLKTQNSSHYDSFSDFKNANFILAYENPDRINGGAVLQQRKEATLHPQIRERLDAFISPNQDVWVGTIALELKSWISGQEYECFSKIFYRKLYDALVSFGQQEKTGFLCLSLPAPEYISTDLLEYWPYVLTIRPKDSKNGLFHSVLALSGTRDEATHFWKSLGLVTKRKDLVA